MLKVLSLAHAPVVHPKDNRYGRVDDERHRKPEVKEDLPK
jgi:hypothetical protein